MHDENARHRAMMLVAEMPGWASYSEPLPDTGLFIFFRGVAGYLSRPCTHKSRLVSSRWVNAMPYDYEIIPRGVFPFIALPARGMTPSV